MSMRRCPECGAPLDVEQTVVEELVLSAVSRRDRPVIYRRPRLAVVVFCSRCDVAYELREIGGTR